MKIAVCEVPDEAMPSAAWDRLLSILAGTASDLLVLPELAGTRAFWVDPQFDPAVWREAIQQTAVVVDAVKGFGARRVIGSRAVEKDGRRLNESYLWTADSGFVAGRSKAWFPQMKGAWEATWFHGGSKEVAPVQDEGLSVATLLCTEVIVSETPRLLGKSGVQLIAVPRATGGHQRWEVATRMAAISAGAFVVTANRRGTAFAGGSWIIGPDGDELARTSEQLPVATIEVDLSLADQAKRTYPRNVVD